VKDFFTDEEINEGMEQDAVMENEESLSSPVIT